ncbi:MAG: NUDIX hydrolase [Planctomycetota bacterium]
MIHKFCPYCGGALETRRPPLDTKDRLICTRCGQIHYLNPKPTVKGAVMKEGKILMVRRAEEPGIGSWDLPGGYLEWGEDPEPGLVREIEEEVGIKVEIVKLAGVYQRVWGVASHNISILNLAYLCRWVSGEAKPLQLHELDQVVWVDPKSPPGRVGYGHYQELMRLIG